LRSENGYDYHRLPQNSIVKKLKLNAALTDGFSVAIYGSVGILQFHELVAHQGPGRQIVGVQLERSLEVLDSLFMLRPVEM
jgi:hypothetical protein